VVRLPGSTRTAAHGGGADAATAEVVKTDRAPVELFPLKRRLAAVMLADVVGYSRLMSQDEEGTHRRIAGYIKNIIDPTIAEYGGRPVRSMGDGMLVEFGSALDAVRCGLDIQQRLGERQHDSVGEKILLRIGINTGDVIVGDRDIYGHSVNITARLETMANAGSVYVSQSIYDQTRSQPGLRFTDRGTHRAKNIDYPLRMFEAAYGQPIAAQRWRVPRKYLAAVAALVVALIAFGLYRAVLPIGGAPANSIIVLPFRNLSASADDEYFADAITDDLTTDLSRIPRSFVISTATAMTFKGKVIDARTIGRDMGVRYLLEGSVRRIEGTARINVQLVDAETGAGLWADRFEHESTDLEDLEDAITRRIATSLHAQTTRGRLRASTAGTIVANHNALDERMRATALIVGVPTPEKYLAARQHAEECLKQDPNSAECWAILARVLISEHLSVWNDIGADGIGRAEMAYKRALELDPSNPGAHLAAGNVLHVRGDLAGALAEFEKAIELDPNFTVAHAQRGRQLFLLGRNQEAAAALQQAMRLSPNDPFTGFFQWGLGRIAFANGNYAEAADWLTKSVAAQPNHWYNRAWLVSAATLAGRGADASAQLAEFTQKFPTFTLAKIQTRFADEPINQSPVFQAVAKNVLMGLSQAGLK
jgi:class 3 adenylate cyclase/TolB-like protein/Tfp pilus assembly protein PilF